MTTSEPSPTVISVLEMLRSARIYQQFDRLFSHGRHGSSSLLHDKKDGSVTVQHTLRHWHLPEIAGQNKR